MIKYMFTDTISVREVDMEPNEEYVKELDEVLARDKVALLALNRKVCEMVNECQELHISPLLMYLVLNVSLDAVRTYFNFTPTELDKVERLTLAAGWRREKALASGRTGPEKVMADLGYSGKQLEDWLKLFRLEGRGQ
jgi:hypothetical protein